MYVGGDGRVANDAAQLRKIARKNGASVRSFLERIERGAKYGEYFATFYSFYDFEQEDTDDICLDLALKGFYVKAYKNITGYFVINVGWENARILGKEKDNVAARMKDKADLVHSACAALREEILKEANEGRISLRTGEVLGHYFGYGSNDINPYVIVRAFEKKGFKADYDINYASNRASVKISWE